MPGIVAGCIIVFMLCAGSYLTPVMLGGKNSMWFTQQIYDEFITRYDWETGATFGVLLLAFTSARRLDRPPADRPVSPSSVARS